MKSEKPDTNELNDPEVSYQRSGGVRVFHSFKEMNDSDAADMAAVPAKERIKNTVELILRAYGVTREQLNARRKTYKISIISKGE